jgi:hypothetical protein
MRAADRERVQVLLAKQSDPGTLTASTTPVLRTKRALVIGINAYGRDGGHLQALLRERRRDGARSPARQRRLEAVFTRVFLKAIGTPGLNLNTLGATVR